MNPADIQKHLLDQHGLRVGTEMADYILGRMAAAPGPIPVIAACARTGRPVAIALAPSDLNPEPQPLNPPQ